MRELTEWARTAPFRDKPWLIVGKGPTFARRDEFDLSRYNLISLNHAVVEQPVELAHVVDLDVVNDCGGLLLENAEFVVMPRHPHLEYRPTVARLEEFVANMPVLRALDDAGRLIWYNAATGPAEDGAPVVDLRNFSSEAALGIVAVLGASVVHSTGVDGGRRYSQAFRSLQDRTLLSNGQPSFNSQFAELDRIAERHEIEYRSLVPPARIFIGGDPEQRVAAEVLQHSILLHARGPVRIDLLEHPLHHLPADERNAPRTPFSFNRFLIPSLMGYEGVALYLDSDMLVFDDVTQLFTLPFDRHAVLCTEQPSPPKQWKNHPDFRSGRQFSVMLIDCARAQWDIADVIAGLDEQRFSYEDLMFDLALVPHDEIDPAIPITWNHLESYEPGATQLVHFTVVPEQPWRSTLNPLRALWIDAFEQAVVDGTVDLDAMERSVTQHTVQPDLVDIADRAVASLSPVDRSPLQVELQALRSRLHEAALHRPAAGPARGWDAVRAVSRRVTKLIRPRQDSSGGP